MMININVKFDTNTNKYIITIGQTKLELDRQDSVSLHNALNKELKGTPPLDLFTTEGTANAKK